MLRLLTVRPCEQHRGGEVDRDPGDRHGQHRSALRLRRAQQPVDALVDDPGTEHEQRHPVQLRGEDLRSLQPERVVAAGRPGGEPHRDQRERDRAGVGEHVAGVGEQCQGVGQHSDHDLDRHEGDDQRQRGEEQLPRSASAEIWCACGPWLWP